MLINTMFVGADGIDATWGVQLLQAESGLNSGDVETGTGGALAYRVV